MKGHYVTRNTEMRFQPFFESSAGLSSLKVSTIHIRTIFLDKFNISGKRMNYFVIFRGLFPDLLQEMACSTKGRDSSCSTKTQPAELSQRPSS